MEEWKSDWEIGKEEGDGEGWLREKVCIFG